MYEDWTAPDDYNTVKIPENKQKKEYETAERRADIYDRIREHGFGQLPTYRELCKDYGLESPNSIKRDIKILRKYIIKHDFNRDKFRATIADNLEWALQQARKDGDPEAVSRIAKRVNNYYQSLGVEEEEPDKVEVENSIAGNLTAAYQKFHGDGETSQE